MIPQKKINNEFWLVKKQGAPHIGSWAAPACQCSVQMFTFSWMNVMAPRKKNEVRTKNENLQLESANQKICQLWFVILRVLGQCWRQNSQLQCERPPGIEISRERTSNAATNTTFNVALLFGTLRQHARSNYIIATNGISWKTLRFGAKRHLRIWSLKFKKSLNLF